MILTADPVKSFQDVKMKIMDDTLTDLAYLAHRLGFRNTNGCGARYVGEDVHMGRSSGGDTWSADVRYCDTKEPRLSIKYNNWRMTMKKIKFDKPTDREMEPEVADTGAVENLSPADVYTSISRTKTVSTRLEHTDMNEVTITKSDTLHESLMLGVMASVGAFGFEVETSMNAEVGGRHTWGKDETNSDSDTFSDDTSKTLSIDADLRVPPNSDVYWDLIVSKQNLSLEYTATMQAHFSIEIKAPLQRGNNNYHHLYRGQTKPYNDREFSYILGDNSTAFYIALKEQSTFQVR